MKRFIFVIFVVSLLINVSPVKSIQELNATLDIQKNGEVYFETIFKFTDDIKEVYLPLDYEITSLKFEGGQCSIEKYEKSTLVCKPISPFIVGQIIIKADFKIQGVALTKNNKTSFELDIPVIQNTEKINVIVKLPELMALIDNDLLPLSPSGADIGSDGRRIILKWNFQDQTAGDIIPLRIYYENLNPTNFLQVVDLRWVILLLAIISVGIFLIYSKISKKSSVVLLSVLTEAERIIVKAIQSEGGKNIDQRKLVSISSFSKAKVSRILQSLEARGVISMIRSGRKNKVTLKKKFVKEETEQ